MKKFLLRFILVNIFVLSALYAGTEINNGGAGISVNGKVATFYSAEMQIKPEPLMVTPTMSSTSILIKGLNLPNRVSVELLENLMPSFERRYYAVKEDTLDQATLDIIKQQYSKITNEPVENITIFALTDPANKITLLLPDYFKLNLVEQMAILFHESLWINERVKNYEHMIEIEKDTQIYAMYPQDCIPRYNITKQIENIFHEKLWTLNTLLRCQTEKYHAYTSAKSIPFTDFASRSETDTLAKILLRFYFKIPVDDQLFELFLTQINGNQNYIFFWGSKTALIQALKDQSINISVKLLGLLHLSFDTANPLSKNNVDILVQTLNSSKLSFDFFDFYLLEMVLKNDSGGITINMTYESINKVTE